MRPQLLPLRLFAALVLSAFLATAFAPAAQAQYFGRNKVQYDDFDFREFSTDHFGFYYYPEEEQATSDAARMAERWYDRHTQTFLRQFDDKKPIIFYANDADFQQTNVVGGRIGQGTGGVTESLKERVTMPLTGTYAETNHVLGHELVHSFQYDIGLRERERGFQINRLPLWLVEGMAEYLSVGRRDPHTAMWLRDYAMRDDLPTMEQLQRNPQTYFPYRFGQSYMAYVGGKYGDPSVANLFKLAGRVGPDSAFVYALGVTPDSLSKEWKQAVRDQYLPQLEGRTRPADIGEVVVGEPGAKSQLSISPSISPDGRYVAFIGRRDIFTTNLFIADTRTGEIVEELAGTRANPHFDALRFINSAGAWSPDGEKFAFVTFVQGDNELNILDVESGEIERRIRVQDVGAIANPAWSPDGRQIAFSGLDGGISDLYLLNVTTDRVRQLTNDRYADLQPTWSPDGETLAFSTDRGPGGTDFETLNFAQTRLGMMDVASGEIEVMRPFGQAYHHNPQFSPDGEDLYFISTQDGFKDVYRYNLASGETFRITNLTTGVSGITASSPAMSVAQQSGRMAFSVFSRGGYTIHTLGAEELTGEPVEPIEEGTIATAGLLPPYRAAGEGLVTSYLDDPITGLPPENRFESEDYDPGLQLDAVTSAGVGVGVSSEPYAGSRVGAAGGIALYFSDLLGNQNLLINVQANGTFKDIGGQATYLNRTHRLNYGAGVGHIPIRFLRQFLVQTNQGPLISRQFQRIYIDQASGLLSYPFNTTRRFDLSLGAVRYGFDYDIENFIQTPGGFRRVDVPDDFRDQFVPDEPDAVYLATGSAAYVGDFTRYGFVSPLQGGRYRFSLSPSVGSVNYVTALADYRRYFFFNPVTFAVRGLHIGNYGADNDRGDTALNFTDEYLAFPYQQGFVRGYSINNLEVDESSAVINRLFGTRIALASAEVRVPLFGNDQLGLVDFPYLPTELALFTDAGLAWTSGSDVDLSFTTDEDDLNSDTRYPVVSAGAAARFNVLGAITLEAYYAFPFQRPGKGGHFGLRFTPGW